MGSVNLNGLDSNKLPFISYNSNRGFFNCSDELICIVFDVGLGYIENEFVSNEFVESDDSLV
jgi:hypothetical protein